MAHKESAVHRQAGYTDGDSLVRTEHAAELVRIKNEKKVHLLQFYGDNAEI